MKNILADVEQKHYFWLKDGRILKNLNDLYNALTNMAEEVFKHHVNAAKNDFHNWVRDIQQDQKLARGLLKAKTREQTANAVKNRIQELQKKFKK